MASWSEGGKAPGSTGARGVLEASQAFGEKAFPPLADCVAVAAQFVSNILVGRVVRRCGTQDNAAAKDEGLRCGPGAEQGFQLEAELGSQFDG